MDNPGLEIKFKPSSSYENPAPTYEMCLGYQAFGSSGTSGTFGSFGSFGAFGAFGTFETSGTCLPL